MPYFVITDQAKKAHIVEANSQGEALAQIPGSISVRIAMSDERRAYIESQNK